MKKIIVIAVVLVIALMMNPVFSANSLDDSGKEWVFLPEANINKVKILADGSIKVRYDLYDESGILMHTDKYKSEVRLYEGDFNKEKRSNCRGRSSCKVF